MRRLTALLLVLLLSASCVALAAEGTLTLRTATTVEEAAQFLLLPPEDDVIGVQPGYIRYIAQVDTRDPAAFRKGYWIGGAEGSMLDLTVKSRNGFDYGFHAGVMCTRAVYSMALSCLGIDMSPGRMSEVTGERNLDEPYDDISALVGVERVMPKSRVFNTMMDNYLNDERYSPVYLYIQKPNGNYHALLVVAYMPDSGRYVVVDSSPYQVDGEPCRVYFISLNKNRTAIINSTFRNELSGSQVLQLYQWRLMDDADE